MIGNIFRCDKYLIKYEYKGNVFMFLCSVVSFESGFASVAKTEFWLCYASFEHNIPVLVYAWTQPIIRNFLQ
jgi:hypothetical protein